MAARRRSRSQSPLLLTRVLIIFGGFFLLSEILGSFFLSAARVSSRSMTPNYASGERVLISHIAYGMTLPFTDLRLPAIGEPRHGQVVILRGPAMSERHFPILRDLWDFFTLNSPLPGRRSAWERGLILRRVIALPGDRVYLSGGRAFVQVLGNGDFLPEHLMGTYDLLLPQDEFDTPDTLNNYYTSTLLGTGGRGLCPSGQPAWKPSAHNPGGLFR